MTIEIRRLTKRFDSFVALDSVNLTVAPGELVALVGPSGSGKTTLLRIIAGLDFASEGQILFDGADAGATHIGQRQVGFVFQHYALFRHMTVFENVAFGLRVKARPERPGKAEIAAKVNQLLSLVQMAPFSRRYPSQLSGGQRQRVALARALAIEPRILLLDEPFGALDAKVRKELRIWLRRLHDDMGLTSVFVTHDQEEALELADRVVVMSQGRIEQVGSPEEVYDHPATAFVSEFMGDTNRIVCPVKGDRVELWGLTLPLPADSAGRQRCLVYVRPQDLQVLREQTDDSTAATIRHVAMTGPLARIRLELANAGGGTAEALVGRHVWQNLALQPGDVAYLRILSVRIFPLNEAN